MTKKDMLQKLAEIRRSRSYNVLLTHNIDGRYICLYDVYPNCECGAIIEYNEKYDVLFKFGQDITTFVSRVIRNRCDSEVYKMRDIEDVDIYMILDRHIEVRVIEE